MSAQEQLKELLRNTGREVAKEVGSHLKSVARDKAVSYAQDLIGEGLADEMGLAAKSVGRTAFSSALSQMGDVKDAASARRVAGSVGRAAASDGAARLAGLAGKYFSGAGTPEQAVKVCAYTVGSLRKIVTAYRRSLSKMSVNDFLTAHAERALASRIVKLSKKKDGATQMNEFIEAIHNSPRDGGYSMAEKRKLVNRIRKALHPPVSKMSREHIVQYIYALALEMNVDWTPFFEAAVEKKRVPKRCYKMTGPGTTEYTAPAQKAKRPPSAYNRFVREHMLTYQFPADTSQKQKMAKIGQLWREEKDSIQNESHYRAVEAEDRAAAAQRKRELRSLSRKGRIPKKGADDDLDLGFDDTPNTRAPPGRLRSKFTVINGQKRRLID